MDRGEGRDVHGCLRLSVGSSGARQRGACLELAEAEVHVQWVGPDGHPVVIALACGRLGAEGNGAHQPAGTRRAGPGRRCGAERRPPPSRLAWVAPSAGPRSSSQPSSWLQTSLQRHRAVSCSNPVQPTSSPSSTISAARLSGAGAAREPAPAAVTLAPPAASFVNGAGVAGPAAAAGDAGVDADAREDPNSLDLSREPQPTRFSGAPPAAAAELGPGVLAVLSLSRMRGARGHPGGLQARVLAGVAAYRALLESGAVVAGTGGCCGMKTTGAAPGTTGEREAPGGGAAQVSGAFNGGGGPYAGPWGAPKPCAEDITAILRSNSMNVSQKIDSMRLKSRGEAGTRRLTS